MAIATREIAGPRPKPRIIKLPMTQGEMEALAVGRSPRSPRLREPFLRRTPHGDVICKVDVLYHGCIVAVSLAYSAADVLENTEVLLEPEMPTDRATLDVLQHAYTALRTQCGVLEADGSTLWLSWWQEATQRLGAYAEGYVAAMEEDGTS